MKKLKSEEDAFGHALLDVHKEKEVNEIVGSARLYKDNLVIEASSSACLLSIIFLLQFWDDLSSYLLEHW